MKINHSKYKNSGILFELLTRQITTDILIGKNSPAVNILKTHFSNSELVKEYKLYNILLSSNMSSESKANILIETTLDLYKKLNKTSLRNQRYNLIKEIKQYYNLDEFFKFKVNNYKAYAAAFTLFESSSTNIIDPELLVRNKITLLEHITKQPQSENIKEQLLEEYSDSDKGMRFLTYKILVEKFNEKYIGLDKTQKEILKEYINNNNNPVLLKEYINGQFIIIKKELKEIYKSINDKTINIKLLEVINLIKPLDKSISSIKDDDILNLMNYSELVKELKLAK